MILRINRSKSYRDDVSIVVNRQNWFGCMDMVNAQIVELMSMSVVAERVVRLRDFHRKVKGKTTKDRSELHHFIKSIFFEITASLVTIL